MINLLREIRIILVFLISTYFIAFYPKDIYAKMISEVQCNATEEKLVYDCMIYLTDMKTKEKISGAKFMVSADMPSMPGAHNIKPVIAHSMRLGFKDGLY